MTTAPRNAAGAVTLFRKVREHRIAELFSHFRSRNIEPILIKGWAAARYYPDDKVRSLGDVDLAVKASQYTSALQVLAQLNTSEFSVDLHNELRHLDSVDWEDLYINSELIGDAPSAIRVLRPEDHLRVLCVHWLNDGGANRDRLWDIYYLISNRTASFDWSRCLDIVSPRRRRWIICTIGLTHKYLGLDIDDLPVKDEAKQIPAWVIKCVEREWRRGGQIRPIFSSFRSREVFVDQIARRLPPNPLRAMIEAEGDIDRSFQFDYQVRVWLRRTWPFISRVPRYLYGRLDDVWSKPPDRE